MRYLWLLAAGSLALLECGCSKPVVMGPKDTARVMKQSAQNLVRRAKENPKAGARQAESFAENLQIAAEKTNDENRSLYEEMARKCKEIAEMSERSGGSGDVTKKLNELTALADKLPGEITGGVKTAEPSPTTRGDRRPRQRD